MEWCRVQYKNMVTTTAHSAGTSSGRAKTSRRILFGALGLSVALLGSGCGWFGDGERPALSGRVSTEPGSEKQLPADSVPTPGSTASRLYSHDLKWQAYILWQNGHGDVIVEGPNGYRKTIECGGGLQDLCNPSPQAFSTDDKLFMYVNTINTGPEFIPAIFVLNLETGESEQITNLSAKLSDPNRDVRRSFFVPDPLDEPDFVWTGDLVSYTARGVHYSINTRTKTVTKSTEVEVK